MKSILLIGSSGFIGKSLISYILKNEKDINIIYYISRTLTKIEESSARLKKIEVDILKLNKIPEVDGVIYLINSNDYKRGLKIFYKFKTLINKFKKKPKILYLSSGAIYGQNSSYICFFRPKWEFRCVKCMKWNYTVASNYHR